MPRRPRNCPAGVPQHVVQRGVNRQICFTSDNDLAAYANWLFEGSLKYEVDIHAWVFMTNHVHLLLTPHHHESISKMMQHIGRYYVHYFNRSYSRSGTLWEGRYRSCWVDQETYLFVCQKYIELNPVRAGLVSDPADYHWSSYQANALGVESKLRTAHPLYQALGATKEHRLQGYRSLFRDEIGHELLGDIRGSLNSGLVLGTGKFLKQAEELTGNLMTLQKPGRPPNVRHN